MDTSKTPHYYIHNIYFTLYMDAIDYCDKYNIDYELIKKTKTYILD